MKRITYRSRATHHFSPDELIALVDSSQSYLQVLGGDVVALNAENGLR